MFQLLCVRGSVLCIICGRECPRDYVREGPWGIFGCVLELFKVDIGNVFPCMSYNIKWLLASTFFTNLLATYHYINATNTKRKYFPLVKMDD